MSFSVGQVVEAYQVVGVLGRGGMGQVYRAEHTITRRVEALKVLLEGVPATSETGYRFLREIQVQASLAHPHIAQVRHAFWWEGHLVMVMEMVEGETLHGLLDRMRLPWAAAVEAVCQTLEALQYAHAHDVVHRDIKSANVMLTPAGVVKLMDFGLARTPGDLRLTQTGTPMGSLHYISPEQIRAVTAPDARSDLYSLGVVFYELATGQLPFLGTDVFALMQAHIEQAPRPPINLAPDLPPTLNDVILTMMAKSPEQRYTGAAQVLAVLAPWRREPDCLRDLALANAEPVRETAYQQSGSLINMLPPQVGSSGALPPLALHTATPAVAAVAESEEPEEPVAPAPDPMRQAVAAAAARRTGRGPWLTGVLLTLAAAWLFVLSQPALRTALVPAWLLPSAWAAPDAPNAAPSANAKGNRPQATPAARRPRRPVNGAPLNRRDTPPR